MLAYRWSACGRADERALAEAVEGVNGDGAGLAVEIDLECGGGFDPGGFRNHVKNEDVTIPMVKGINMWGRANGDTQRVAVDGDL